MVEPRYVLWQEACEAEQGRLHLTQGGFGETFPYILRGLENGKRKQKNQKIFGRIFHDRSRSSAAITQIATPATELTPVLASREINVESVYVCVVRPENRNRGTIRSESEKTAPLISLL